MNTYQANLNLNFLKNLCRNRGVKRTFRKGEIFVSQGALSSQIGFIESGYFHYTQTGQKGEFITGFAFHGEFVADYPRCLYGLVSDISIVCAAPSEVWLMDARILLDFFSQSIETERMGRLIAEQIFLQTYAQMLSLYTKSAEERYRHLLARNPEVTQQISLKELASFLRVTPTTISAIRRRITFG